MTQKSRMFSLERSLRLLLLLATFDCCTATASSFLATVAATLFATSAAANMSTTASPQSEAERLLETLHYSVHGSLASEGDQLTVVNLDQLEDDVIAGGVEGGVQNEFDDVDRGLGEDPTSGDQGPLPAHRANRQLSLINQGVYVPDARFNAFVDGVMVNMVAEMRRRRMDPLYFRVHKGGRVQHVPTRRRTGKNKDSDTTREGRQQDEPEPEREAIGGGVIRGLTKIKRFGNGEVQVAGNSTLIRGHWLCGPLDLIIDYRNETGRVTRVRTGLQAVQLDSLTIVDRFGAEMETFKIVSPLFQLMPYMGNRTEEQQEVTEIVVRHLFSNGSFMAWLLRDAFEIASYDKIIPQFGTDSSYYSVLQYLLNHSENNIGNFLSGKSSSSSIHEPFANQLQQT